MTPQDAKNALALIDQVNAGPGAYRDENIAAVSRVRASLHNIASGKLVVVEPPKLDAAPEGVQKDLQK